MRIEQENDHFVIVAGKPRALRYFQFFVDADSACWSKNNSGAAHYSTPESAEASLAKIRDRLRLRREKRSNA